jgi:hypothetical protein
VSKHSIIRIFSLISYPFLPAFESDEPAKRDGPAQSEARKIRSEKPRLPTTIGTLFG